MNIEQTREACLAMHPKVEEGSPFEALGHPDIAFKIAGKIFAYLCMPDAPSCDHGGTSNLIVLKSDPERAIELREQYPGIIEPAWHWNKKFWNQIRYDRLPEAMVKELIAESFRLVTDKLTKKTQKELFGTI